MKRLFIDAAHLVALANPRDQWHQKAVRVADETSHAARVTSEEVLVEFLNFYSEHGEYMRQKVVDLTRALLLDVRVEVVTRPETAFLEALELYESRLDKGYSLTDCISMNICKKADITDVLTHDEHFRQEGFVTLL